MIDPATLALVGMGLLVVIWLSNLRQVWSAAHDPRYRIAADRYEGPAPGDDLVSVVVPARNEERNLGACLDALCRTDHERFEVIVVDDRSEDGTREVAERYAGKDALGASLKIVEGQGPPAGWMGKVAAVWRGQQEASGDWLLFLDADVRIAPEAIRQCVHYCRDNAVDGVTLIGFLDNHGFWERTVQPVVGSLVLAGNRPDRVNDPKRSDAMANGQFIFVSRETYDAVGGHAELAGEVLDDVGFARLVKSKGRALHLCYGRELFQCRMYHGLGEIWEGWSKNLFPGLHNSLGLLAIIWSLVFATALLPFLLLPWLSWVEGPGHPLTILAAVTVGLVYATYASGLYAVRQPVGYFWTYPIGVVVMLGILLNSAFRIRSGLGVTWKGRTLKDTGTGGPKVRPGGAGDDPSRSEGVP